MALNSNDENEINMIISELKGKGYFNIEDNTIGYPISIPKWSSIINNDGIIKIKGVLYRFLKNDMISVDDNNIETLVRIGNKNDYQKFNVKYTTICEEKNDD